MAMLFNQKTDKVVYTILVAGILFFAVPFIERSTAPTIISATPKQMVLAVFDVGQGDAILAQVDDMQILIDGGPNDRVLEKIAKVMPAGDRTIDLVVLTHPHSDHIVGLTGVLDRYSVGRVMMTDVVAPTAVFRRWRELITEKEIIIHNPQTTKTEIVGQMEFEVLSSDSQANILRSEHNGNSDGLNDSSIVGVIKFGSHRFLLMGDATSVVEDRLHDSGANLKSNFFKVGHHGSTYSTNDNFINTVAPEFAVISVGAKNSYGNPAWRVIQLFKNKAIAFFRTDQDGDVVAVTDGNSLQVRAEKVR